jgi:flagellar export protein FliJ
MAEPLQVVLRIRQATVDHAKSAMAKALQAEAAALLACDRAEALIDQEAQRASDLSVGDGAVEAFAAWLPVGRAKAQAARLALEDRAAGVAVARAGLSVARTAAEAAKTMLDQLHARRAAELARKEQITMDEVASQLVARRADDSTG